MVCKQAEPHFRRQFELVSADTDMAAKGAGVPQTCSKDRPGGRDRRANNVADGANYLDRRCRGVDVGSQQRDPGFNGQPTALLCIPPHLDQGLFDPSVRRRPGSLCSHQQALHMRIVDQQRAAGLSGLGAH